MAPRSVSTSRANSAAACHNGGEPRTGAARASDRLAFLTTFSVLLGAGAVWMGLFVWLVDADSARLNVIAGWISPERISGWVFYFLLSIVFFVPVAKRFLGHTREPH